MNEKRKNAGYLFSELSGISDIFVNEAMAVQKRRWKPRTHKLLAATAVAAVLLFAVLVPWMLYSLSSKISGNGASFRLTVSTAAGETFADAADIGFFDGEVKLIISESDGYRTVLLTGASREKIIKIMSSGNLGQLSESDDGQTELPRVWLSLGDGRIISPYLKYSPGNIGAGVLFDYEPEGEPPKKLTEYISGLLS